MSGCVRERNPMGTRSAPLPTGQNPPATPAGTCCLTITLSVRRTSRIPFRPDLRQPNRLLLPKMREDDPRDLAQRAKKCEHGDSETPAVEVAGWHRDKRQPKEKTEESNVIRAAS